MTLHLTATERHLPCGITQCYLPADTSERAPPNPSHAGWYSIYLPRRDGRLSWPSWLDSAPAGSRTSDLSITSPTANHCTTKTASCRLSRASIAERLTAVRAESTARHNETARSSIRGWDEVVTCDCLYVCARTLKNLSICALAGWQL